MKKTVNIKKTPSVWKEKLGNLYFNIMRVLWPLIDAAIPNKPNLLIFSGDKNRFAGNSGILFEFALKQPDFESYFMVHSKKMYNKWESRFPGHVINSYTFTGFWKYLRARVVFITHGKGDVRPWHLSSSVKLVVNLWHGTSFKRIGDLDEGNEFKKAAREYSAITVSSVFEKKCYYQAFGPPPSKYWLTGTPRNDTIFQKEVDVPEETIILYAPTWRDASEHKSGVGARPFPLNNFRINELIALLEKYKAKLMLRWHSNDLNKGKKEELQNYTRLSDRIVLAGPDEYPDIQQLMLTSSILITDYSSIMLDFLLLDRPIIFFPYDYEEFNHERGFFYDYNLFSPGPKVLSHLDFMYHLEQFLSNPELGFKWRKLVRSILFSQEDGKASERIIQKVRENIERS